MSVIDQYFLKKESYNKETRNRKIYTFFAKLWLNMHILNTSILAYNIYNGSTQERTDGQFFKSAVCTTLNLNS